MKPSKQKKTAGLSKNQLSVYSLPVSFGQRMQTFLLSFGLTLALTGLNVTTNMSLQGSGKYAQATFLALCRQGLFFIPLVIMLPRVIGLYGVLFAQAVSDVLTFFTSIHFYRSFLEELRLRAKKEPFA